MELNLRENIVAYRETHDKNILESLYLYFDLYINNISKKIYSEYAEVDLIIGFIEIINNLNLKEASNEIIKKKIIKSLIRKRVDIIRRNIKENKLELCFWDELYLEPSYEVAEISEFLTIDLINLLSDKQRKVLFHSFIERKNDVEISKIMNIKKQSVGQLKKRALENLKKLI